MSSFCATLINQRRGGRPLGGFRATISSRALQAGSSLHNGAENVMSIRIGYLLPTRERVMAGQPQAAPLLELAERTERLGFDSVWAGDSLLARPRHAGTTGTDMDKDYLTLKRASASRPSGHWYDDG